MVSSTNDTRSDDHHSFAVTRELQANLSISLVDLEAPEFEVMRNMSEIEMEMVQVEASLVRAIKAGGGMQVTFSDLSYSVPIKGGQEKTILHPMSGYFEPGQITAM